MIGCGQALPGQNCVPNDVALSAAVRTSVSEIDLLGFMANLGSDLTRAVLHLFSGA